MIREVSDGATQSGKTPAPRICLGDLAGVLCGLSSWEEMLS